MSSCCRFCQTPLGEPFLDLGPSPLANAYIKEQKKFDAESFYPLQTFFCQRCHLVQVQEFESPAGIFSDYAYMSSYSSSWLAHSQKFSEDIRSKVELNQKSLVVEVGSNDGYLLQFFKKQGIPVLGVEPAANVAQIATEKGIPTRSVFFGSRTAEELKAENLQADLLIGNNVLAHVPDINSFVRGLKVLLKDTGIISIEFPHLLNLIYENQFDTIYHEHFSYLSLTTVERIFAQHGLTIFDVEELPTHGGSLRIFGCHNDNLQRPVQDRVKILKKREQENGLFDLKVYQEFRLRAHAIKYELLEFLIKAKRSGKKVIGYGAPAKGNTLLNFCGIKPDLLECTVDLNPYKQGSYLPGCRIPIYAPEKIKELKPDYIFILPWNLSKEITTQLKDVKTWGCQFLIAVPQLKVIE